MPQINEPYFVLDKEGNPVAAVVPIDDYEILLDALEEINDLEMLDRMRENGEMSDTIPFEQVKAELTRQESEESHDAHD